MGATFVGEAPGPSGRVGFEGWAGMRLAGLLGLEPEEAAERFEFVNLLKKWPGPQGYKHHAHDGGKGSRFPRAEAARQARRLAGLMQRKARPRAEHTVVLLGRRVAAAWGGTFPEFFEPCPWAAYLWVVVVPHPSGCNRFFNDPANKQRFKDWAKRSLFGGAS